MQLARLERRGSDRFILRRWTLLLSMVGTEVPMRGR